MSDTHEKWVDEFTNIVDEYQIAHKGNYQCKCISGARGHLIAKSIDFIRKTREEAKREAIDKCWNEVLKIKENKVTEFRDKDEYMRGYSNARIDALQTINFELDSLTSKEGEETV